MSAAEKQSNRLTALGATRREMLQLGALALAVTGVSGCQEAMSKNAPMSAAGSSMAPRREVSLNTGWKFLKQGYPGAQAMGLDDSGWSDVTVPHTWNGMDSQRGGPYYRGPAWYRRELTLPADATADSRKRFYLYFEAVAMEAQVFVNGELAITHAGGFSAFCCDATDLLHRSGKNVIAVRADNSPTLDIQPIFGDFNWDGGMVRPVRLLILDELCISPLDFAGPGVYVKQSNVTAGAAELEVTTKVLNAGKASKAATLRLTVQDADGKAAAAVQFAQGVSAGSTSDLVYSLTLENPHLWDARNDPYLYQVVAELMDGDRMVDRVVQPLGVRWFHVDAKEGFFLNSKPYRLYGVCSHQDRPNVGRAVSESDLRQDVQLVHELGARCLRLAHYQHPQAAYSEADRLGIVVWAEDGLVNRINNNEQFYATSHQMLTELIKQNFNHPSICFWSLFNELGGNQPLDLVRQLNALAKKLDPTRLTTAACNCSPGHPMAYITDLASFNRYPGWYGGSPKQYPHLLDNIHETVEGKMPGRPVAMSEYGAGASIYQHETNVMQPNPGSYWHPEEWQGIVHEAAWAAIKDRHWLWGTFLWVMFDFAVATRAEGDHPGKNDKGLMTRDRKTRKDAFYFYKAQWTTEPFVHITDRRFTVRPDDRATFKVYSNCQTVELMLNGKSLGTQHGKDGVFVWPQSRLNIGLNHVRAIGQAAGKHYEDAYATVYDPKAPHHATYL